MNEEFVCFELAKKLKEKEFTCEMPFAMYNELGTFHLLTTSAPYNVSSSGYKYREYYDYDDFDEYDCVAPTISQVLKWLRDEKKIHIQIIVYENGWYFEVWQYDESPATFKFQGEDCGSYEQAALAGITWALDNLI